MTDRLGEGAIGVAEGRCADIRCCLTVRRLGFLRVGGALHPGGRFLSGFHRQDGYVTLTLEWWPDYGGGPLWHMSGRGGQHADSRALGLPQDLAGRLAVWNQEYAEDKLPVGGDGDCDWLEQGRQLLAEVRQCLAGRFEIAVTEPW
jgi:hypothetical protein